MLYVLFVLLAGLGWGLWFILRFNIFIAVGVSGGMLLLMVITFIVKRVLASRAATGLERALADQGRQQAMNANPQARGEINELQKQISDGIKALKSSKLGGKQRGRAALYALPWYAIIGPPGAGKTTALRHSGLVFPYADSAIRGVGGTKNCDWWFTNEAILLDTAGRYATEAADTSEWLAFLDLLRKYRGNKPLNGLMVAIAIPDIIDADEQHLDAMATKLRTRVDEVMTRLKMTLPVYLILTKCDLVAGFVEFFGGMRKSERGQAWGATIDLKEDKSNPAELFTREFDVLVSQVHAMTCSRLVAARDRKSRESIYQFPIEFSGIRRNLSTLIARVFAPNAFQGTPIFRGFYFTSGTQEGLPMNRVLERMGHAMGIRPMQMGQMPQVESKSYFLHDVFMRVIFPDAEVAARSAGEIRRQKIVRFSVSAVALTVALTFCVPSMLSYFNNQELLEDTKVKAEKASKIDWKKSGKLNTKLNVLQPVLDRLTELDEHEEEGVPLGYGFLMYSGDRVQKPLVRVFVANMQQGFVNQCKFHLEDQLKAIEGKNYFEERLMLKTYLMLSDPKHLDVEWATGRYTTIWAELNKPDGSQTMYELKQQVEPFVRYYFELLEETKKRKARATPVEANEKIVKRARGVLAKVEPRDRYAAMFIEALNHEVWDPTGDVVRTNQQYPPLSLEDVFDGRDDVLERFTSKKHKETEKWYWIDGVYTDVGHYGVLVNFKQAEKILTNEKWVVPLTKAEQNGGIEGPLKAVATDYEKAYIEAWRGFMQDLYLVPPANLKEAADLYKLLLDPERPYIRLLRTVEEHTQWTRDLAKVAAEREKDIKVKKRRTEEERRERGEKLDIDITEIVGRKSRVPGAFLPMVRFGIAERGKPSSDTPLAQWAEIVKTLRVEILRVLDARPDAPADALAEQIKDTILKTQTLLNGLDNTSREAIAPLLLIPLNVGGKFIEVKPK